MVGGLRQGEHTRALGWCTLAKTEPQEGGVVVVGESCRGECTQALSWCTPAKTEP
jgi:hypothetical protein